MRISELSLFSLIWGGVACTASKVAQTSECDRSRLLSRQASAAAFAQPAPGILAALPSADESLLSAYYPPAILNSIDQSESAVDFILSPPRYLAIAPKEPVTAGGEPGQYPIGQSIATSESWAPSVQSWLSGRSFGAPLTPAAASLTIPMELAPDANSPNDAIIAADPVNSDPIILNTNPLARRLARQAQMCTMSARTGYKTCGSTALNGMCVVSCSTGYYGGSTQYQCIQSNGVATFRNTTKVATCSPTTLCSKYTCPGMLDMLLRISTECHELVSPSRSAPSMKFHSVPVNCGLVSVLWRLSFYRALLGYSPKVILLCSAIHATVWAGVDSVVHDEQ